MDAVEKKTVGKYLVEICYDPEPSNPRVEFDNLTTMACFHGKYLLGDQGNKDFPWKNSSKGGHEFQQWLKEHENEVVYKRLSLYDHSGLTISTCNGYPYNDQWDAGTVGVVYVEKAKILSEFGLSEWGPEAEEKADHVIEGEVKTYDYFLRGSVYGYTITDTEIDEEVDSCWGFIGEREYCLKEATQVAEFLVIGDKSWEEQAVTSVRYLQVRVEIKHSEGIDPDDVISECEYNFTSQTQRAKTTKTEIQEQQEKPFN